MLTIVTYHYVRDLPHTRFPAIHGLRTADFEGQLDYIARHYTVVGFRDVIAAMRGGPSLPTNACILTFDDGLLDHYATVFPRLVARGMVGSFFPSTRAVLGREMLPVHKIHFLNAAVHDHHLLMDAVLRAVQSYRGEHEIPDDATLVRDHAVAGRYDPPETMFVKRTLQYALPDPVRLAVLDTLFSIYVSDRPRTFVDELYLDLLQLQTMVRFGMEVGGHGGTHAWLGKITAQEQERELTDTCTLLTAVYGHPPTDWVMSYPHGSFNATTHEILMRLDCTLGVTIRQDIVTSFASPLELPRLDANDMPTYGSAAPTSWTQRVLAGIPIAVA